MSPEAFIHVPGLRERLTPPDQSDLRVTTDVLAFWDRRARDMGRSADWRLSDQELRASRRAALGERCGAEDLWVYSYGSLMWDPGFHFAEIRRADLEGHQRRFTYKTLLGRGSPESPGLMLTLERERGCCSGLAFRIPAHLADAETEILWRREMIRGGYCPALLPVDTPQGTVQALVFTVNQQHPDYAGDLSLAETAAMIARGSGVMGTNLDYLEKLAAQLAHLEIEDAYVGRLLEQVLNATGT